jgi:hypothetical protein
MNDRPVQRSSFTISARQSFLQSFSSFLVTETILMFALLAFVPAAFGQAPPPGGDILTKDLSLDLGQLKSHFKPIFEEFGEHSKTKIEGGGRSRGC